MEQPSSPSKKEDAKSSAEKKEDWAGRTGFYLKAFNNFLSLSDEPGKFIKDQEKNEVANSGSVEALNKLIKEKTGSKYRRNAFTFLSYAERLLSEPEFKKIVASEEIDVLRKNIEELVTKIKELREKDEPITKIEVEKGIEIIHKLKSLISNK